MKAKFSFVLTLVFVFLAQGMLAQGLEKQISGTVTDNNGLPVPGVNITIKGTTQGTVTDFDGNYEITATTGQSLVFSAVGFSEQTITVGAETTVDVVMKMGTSLDKVVVTAFGRKMTRNETTASVVTVGAEEISKSPSVSATEALKGKVSGLTMQTSSGTPGAAPDVRLRGINSITADNSPLYVVDGVPVNSGNVSGSSSTTSMNILSMINPADIESISVLKGASAVAPYGAEGANGVILITTKSGKRGEAKFNLSYSTGIKNNAVDGLDMANGAQRFTALKQGVWNAYGSGQFGAGLIASKDQIVDFYTTNFGDGMQKWIDAGKPSYNWSDLVANDDAIINNVSLSVSQGSEKSSLYASIGYNETEGTVIGSNYRRISGNIKYNTELTDKLDFQVSALISNANQQGVLENAAYFSNPNLAKYFISPWLSPYNEDGSLNTSNFRNYSGGLFNVLYTSQNDIISNDVTRGLINTSLTYHILDNLTLTSKLGLDYTLAYFKQFQNPIHGDGKSAHGADSESSSRYYNYTTQNTLDYEFTLGEKNNFRLTAVQAFSKYKNKSLSAYGEILPLGLTNLSGAAANFDAESVFTDRMSMRYVGLLNYNYDEKYLLSASYSYQGDSRFSDVWGSFYSVGAGWNIHEENFMNDVEFVDMLRLKAGYGVVGNAGIGRNLYQQLVTYGSYRNASAGFVTGYGTDATWEKGKRFDLALHFAVLDRRLSGTLGYYDNKTEDMLLYMPLPLSSTFIGANGARVLQNVGSMSNRGFEVELHGDIIKTPDFNWDMGIVFSTVKNEVTALPGSAEDITGAQVIQQGHVLHEWYMREWAGVNPDNGLPLWYVNRTESNATTSNYYEAEKVHQDASPLPTYNGSISTHIGYKNFFLEGSLYFSGGNKVYEEWSGYTHASGSGLTGKNIAGSVVDGAWTHPGDVGATAPRFDLVNGKVANAARTSTRFLYDGDYMRLSDLAIGYTFDRELVEQIGLDGLTLSVRGTNLFTWVKDDDLQYDPSVPLDGYTNLATPPTKTILLNVNLKF